VRQHRPQLFPKSLLVQKMRPNDHSAMGGQTLVGKSNSDGRSRVFGVNWQAPIGPPPVEAQELVLVSSPQARQMVSLFSS
jgi:hypothetical protein